MEAHQKDYNSGGMNKADTSERIVQNERERLNLIPNVSGEKTSVKYFNTGFPNRESESVRPNLGSNLKSSMHVRKVKVKVKRKHPKAANNEKKDVPSKTGDILHGGEKTRIAPFNTGFSNLVVDFVKPSFGTNPESSSSTQKTKMGNSSVLVGKVKVKVKVKVKGKHPKAAKNRKRKNQVSIDNLCEQRSGASEIHSTIQRLGSLSIQDKTEDPEGRPENTEFFHLNSYRMPEIESGNIDVSYPFPAHDNKLQLLNVGESKNDTVYIINHQPGSLILHSVEFLFMKPHGSFNFSVNFPNVGKSKHKGNSSSALIDCPRTFESGEEFTLKLTCKAAMMGLHQLVILFDFGDEKIVRNVSLMAEDELATNLAAVKPFEKKGRSIVHKPLYVHRAMPPSSTGFGKRMGQYKCPEELRLKLLQMGTLPIFSSPLSEKTYVQYFSALLYAEEIQMEKQIREYDMENVTLKAAGEFLVLKVPGLLDRRPSVIYRDAIYVTPFSSDFEYEGFVYRVKGDEVFLKFGKEFNKVFSTNSHVNVHFSFQRTNLRRAHQAINSTNRLPLYLFFPTEFSPMNNPPPFPYFSPFNKALNKEQTSAVQEIMKRCSGGPPYLIYGPPGTGKTITLVEAILQVLKHSPNARILACAPSNTASDVLLERLIGHLQEKDMLRLNAYSRWVEETPPQIQPYTLTENGFFTCPPRETLIKYRVIISTFTSTAYLHAEEIGRGHFSHIFLDEAGQGTEPEIMIPIANFVGTRTVLVLAGDQHQLGPVIFSPIAEKHGLGKSYLERLSLLPLYNQTRTSGAKTVDFNKSIATKLIRNYRSHPAILNLPSHLFYNGELIACAPKRLRSSLCDWKELPNKSFPVLFIGIEGKQDREGKNPSWFNAQEASKVVKVVKKLQAHRKNPVNNEEIGIISPYNQQVKKLKRGLSMKGINGIKVGSVEEFQGQERRVIIISTARSSVEVPELGKSPSIGFLSNPRRFNVAITRAKALVVIIGNPYVLSQDLCWSKLIQYCLMHGSYIGCAPPSKEHSNDLKLLFQKMDELFPKKSRDSK